MIYGVAVNDLRGWRKSKDRFKYKAYELYRSMIQRCYSLKVQKLRPTYKGCTVCEQWLVFSNFANDLPQIEGFERWLAYINNPNTTKTAETIFLDKDSKQPGNKEYSLEACKFISLKESNAELNRRYAGTGKGPFSTKAISKRITPKFKEKMKQIHQKVVDRQSVAVKVIDVINSTVCIYPSLRECGRNIGVSKGSITYAISKGTLIKNRYKPSCIGSTGK